MDPTQSPSDRSSTPPGLLGPVFQIPIEILRRGRRAYRGVERSLAARAPTRALVAVPRTAKFVGTTAWRASDDAEPMTPVPRPSPALAAQVAIDETILALAMGPNRLPRRADYERVSAELAHARLLFQTSGWLDDPASYHRAPPPLTDPVVGSGWALGQRYERLEFPSEWEPRPDEPGAERWNSYEPNRNAMATVLRHQDGPRRWVVALHGFATGYAFMDFIGLHALHLHRDLGFNVVMPVLPLHGSRKISRMSGESFLSFDLLNSLHGLTQAVWDVRRVLDWVRGQEPLGVSLYGVSLGAYVASLLTGLVDDLDSVVAGIPVVDFPELFRAQSPHHIRLRAVEHEILDGNAEIVHRVVSPLAFAPRIDPARRFIFAGLGDRMAPPTQAHALWRHWDEPEIFWYGGNHVGYLWSKQVTSFLNRCLTEDAPPSALNVDVGPEPAPL